MAINRTNEFIRIIKNKNVNNEIITNSNLDKNKNMKTYKKDIEVFNNRSNKLNIIVNVLEEKLKDLKLELNESSLFKQNSNSISNISLSIKKDIEFVSSEIKSLSLILNNSYSNSHLLCHNKKIIEQLNSKLSKATKSFQEDLAKRSEKLLEYNKRKKLYSSEPKFKSRNFNSLLLDENQTALNEEIDSQPQSQSINQISSQKDLKLKKNEVATTRYYSGRLAAAQNIENTITELSSMYHRLASIVSFQDEVCERIDTNVGGALRNVDEGHVELQKYYLKLSGNRLLIVKALTMLIFISVLFVVFLG